MDPVNDRPDTARLIATWDGTDYEWHSSHQRQWGSGFIAELPLRGDERILDLGCGDGSLTRRLADRVTRGCVLGVDAALGMLDTARAKSGANLQFEHVDIAEIGFDREFDVIFSNAALHWVSGHAALLARLHRALRPRGIMRAQFGGDGNCHTLLQCLRNHMAAKAYGEAFAAFRWPWYFPSVAEYEALLHASPFRRFRLWMETKDQVFASAEALIGWIDNRCLIPFLQALPSALRQDFRNAVVNDTLAQCRRLDGMYAEQFRRINVWAQRPGDAG